MTEERGGILTIKPCGFHPAALGSPPRLRGLNALAGDLLNHQRRKRWAKTHPMYGLAGEFIKLRDGACHRHCHAVVGALLHAVFAGQVAVLELL